MFPIELRPPELIPELKSVPMLAVAAEFPELMALEDRTVESSICGDELMLMELEDGALGAAPTFSPVPEVPVEQKKWFMHMIQVLLSQSG